MIRTSRTCARLIWFHVPLSFSPPQSSDPHGTTKEGHTEIDQDEETAAREKEVRRVMAEKRMALDLVEG